MARLKKTNKIKITNISKTSQEPEASSAMPKTGQAESKAQELMESLAAVQDSHEIKSSYTEEVNLKAQEEESTYEIDDFSKALLEKKTEIQLFGEEEPVQPENAPMSPEELKEAEDTMHSALDELRRSRGQVPIDQEEEDFQWNQTLTFEDRFGDEDNFTTASLFGNEALRPDSDKVVSEYENTQKPAKENFMEEVEQRPQPEQKKKWFFGRKKKNEPEPEMETVTEESIAQDVQTPEVSSIQRTDKVQNETEPEELDLLLTSAPTPVLFPSQEEAAAASLQEPAIPAQQPDNSEEEPAKPKRKVRKKAIWVMVAIVSLFLLLFGGYAYKVLVYDPANTITDVQQTAFDKLRDYAEGFDKALSEEKLELLDLEDDYKSLSEKQKTEINRIFKEFTGSNVSDLISQLKNSKTIDSDSNPDYIALLDFVNAYASKDEAQQNSLTQYLQTYNRLSDPLKANINNAMQAQVQTDFMGQYNQILQRTGQGGSSEEAQPEADAQNQQSALEQQPADYSAQIQALQNEITQLQSDRDNYASFLQSEGLPVDGDATLAGYDNEIAYRQSLINSMSGQ